MNVGWENQTWFFPDKELSQSDLDHALSVMLAFDNISPPASLRNHDILIWLIQLHSKISPNKPHPVWIKNTKSLSEFLGVEVLPMANISRGNFSVLLDAIIDPFNLQPINLYGKYILDQ
jgi:hypothetical protein